MPANKHKGRRQHHEHNHEQNQQHHGRHQHHEQNQQGTPRVKFPDNLATNIHFLSAHQQGLIDDAYKGTKKLHLHMSEKGGMGENFNNYRSESGHYFQWSKKKVEKSDLLNHGNDADGTIWDESKPDSGRPKGLLFTYRASGDNVTQDTAEKHAEGDEQCRHYLLTESVQRLGVWTSYGTGTILRIATLEAMKTLIARLKAEKGYSKIMHEYAGIKIDKGAITNGHAWGWHAAVWRYTSSNAQVVTYEKNSETHWPHLKSHSHHANRESMPTKEFSVRTASTTGEFVDHVPNDEQTLLGGKLHELEIALQKVNKVFATTYTRDKTMEWCTYNNDTVDKKINRWTTAVMEKTPFKFQNQDPDKPKVASGHGEVLHQYDHTRLHGDIVTRLSLRVVEMTGAKFPAGKNAVLMLQDKEAYETFKEFMMTHNTDLKTFKEEHGYAGVGFNQATAEIANYDSVTTIKDGTSVPVGTPCVLLWNDKAILKEGVCQVPREYRRQTTKRNTIYPQPPQPQAPVAKPL
jgi:hypothetical protein